MYVYIHTHLYTHIHIHMCIYIYIYREREITYYMYIVYVHTLLSDGVRTYGVVTGVLRFKMFMGNFENSNSSIRIQPFVNYELSNI